MKEQKILLNLPNGDQLVAEECTGETNMIFMGVMRDGVWIQDLVGVETAHDEDFNYIEDKFIAYVYGNEYSEDYTDKFEINRVPSNAL